LIRRPIWISIRSSRAHANSAIRLETLGLISFCKTTGGKGLHVVTPLSQPKNGKLDWPVAKAFAREVVMQMAADSPDRYLITMAKKIAAEKFS